jgi:hypothetical protein
MATELSPRAIRTLVALAAMALMVLAGLSIQVSRSDGSSIAISGTASAGAAQAPKLKLVADREPAGRENPLVPLPEDGTPVLQVRPGESVDLYSHPGGKPVVTLGDTTEWGSPTVLTVLERKGNWVGVPTEKLANGELGWVKLGGGSYEVDSVGTKVDVDLSSMTAKLLRDGEVERSWTIGIGAPDTPTPTGTFAITDKLTTGLNPVYGCCALPITATQPNLPAGWTGGNRMAIHGTTSALGQATSTGCVRSSDEDLHALIDAAPLGTPVEIHD